MLPGSLTVPGTAVTAAFLSIPEGSEAASTTVAAGAGAGVSSTAWAAEAAIPAVLSARTDVSAPALARRPRRERIVDGFVDSGDRT